MENSALLHLALLAFLDKTHYQDVRHLKTLANMIVGAILSKTINLTEWIPFAQTRAKIAQSTQRRYLR